MAAISAHLTRVELPFEEVIFGYEDPIKTVFFMESGVASAILTMENGATVEVATVGHEGAVGLSAWMGKPTAAFTVVCQTAGTAQAMPLDALKREAAARPAFADLLHRSVQALAIQSMYSAGCNALHSLEQRLARWLLMSHDRLQADDMPLTQQFLAYMLGVYRPSVTVVARSLQAADLIRYQHGRVTIVDRKGLEAAACECYAANKEATDALVPPLTLRLG